MQELKVAALYILHDDPSWLRQSMESVYGVVDRLYMVVNERSLTGSSADDLGPVSAEILTFPDPDCKVTYRVGVWARRDPFRAEALQRNRSEEHTSELQSRQY